MSAKRTTVNSLEREPVIPLTFKLATVDILPRCHNDIEV